jgi:redox-sensitive bicupin YhaK (pirin superfamily)
MSNAILELLPLGFAWEAPDPFLFCVHHDDQYPHANDSMGPAASLEGRELGQDFAGKDGWRMYHGDKVPGFPYHPHRGFETVTVVRRGLIDHADSMGATARYGHGDTQWLTAGRGILHSEMFPLLQKDQDNPAELFQIWLNLPRVDKMVEPHFTMFWNDQIPRVHSLDAAGRSTDIEVIAGALGDAQPPSPPPHSWANRPDAHVAIWMLKLAPGAQYTLPATPAGVHRTLYFFAGKTLQIDGQSVDVRQGAKLRPGMAVSLANGPEESELLLLQGRPIGEPVVQHGPFVMNTRQEIADTFQDYQRTQFGGWNWPSSEPVHARTEGRFARHADGKVERPKAS